MVDVYLCIVWLGEGVGVNWWFSDVVMDWVIVVLVNCYCKFVECGVGCLWLIVIEVCWVVENGDDFIICV